MRSCRFARNTQVLLSLAFALSSAGTAFADEKNLLPEVINNVHVPIGTVSIQGLNFGVSQSPDGVVVNPRTNRIYSVEASGGGAFTPATGWTMSVIDGKVTDGTWNKIIKNIQLSNDPNLGSNFPAVNTKTNKIYVDSGTSGSFTPSTQSYVLVIDGNTNNITKKITTNPVVTGIAVNESTNKIYISCYWADTVQVIDGNTDKVIKTIPTHTPQDLNNPYDQLGQPAVSEKLNKIYVPNYLDGSVTVIDGATDTLITSEDDLTCPATVNGYPNCAPIAAAVNNDKVYIVGEGNNSIMVLDAKTYGQIGTIPLSPKSTIHPYGIDIDKEANLIYVADPSGFVDVVDGETNKLVGIVPVGLPTLNTGDIGVFNAFQLSVDSRHHRLYVATEQSGALAVLKTFGHDRHWQESKATGPE
jgi:DNA-binding beta-propeller fold protein YncE